MNQAQGNRGPGPSGARAGQTQRLHHDGNGHPLQRTYYVHWDGSEELVADDTGNILCPLCKSPYVNEQIFQCPDGHLFCGACVRKNRRLCPNMTCQRQVSRNQPIRNRQLEHIFEHTNVLMATNSLTVIEPQAVGSADGDNPEVNEPTPAPTHPEVLCSNCSFLLPVIGVRFQCTKCPNYLLCDKCADIGHHAQHVFVLLTNSESVNKANSFLNYCTRNTRNQVQTKPPIPMPGISQGVRRRRRNRIGTI